MNAILGHAAIADKDRERDLSFLRRVQSASHWELQLMKRAHANLGCDRLGFDGEHDFGCWKCVAIRRAEK